ncbi:hypothetical protein NJBCHELONAE_43150 [Mycobacteroides chelonae]|uniref:hypothetical protein n=1 Tax=Mycobacteroides chelonae TaxID=1774 RepID=UPI0021DBB709|nr:hypothetical protein [Mycobacteroides chelonae]GLE59004.1 hypothetical protein NJBCHELONAE_43150 [Mycobacteroides chelonae]
MAKAVIYVLMWLILPNVQKYAGVTAALAFMGFMVILGIVLLVTKKDRSRNEPSPVPQQVPGLPIPPVVHHVVHHVPGPGWPPSAPVESSSAVHPARRGAGSDRLPSWAWPSNN